MAMIVGDVEELGIDGKLVRDFYSKQWKRKIALSLPSFYKWQFTMSPSDDGDDHCMVAIDDDSHEVLGVMGLNTRPFILNGDVEKGAELTTWIVNKNFTGCGIGKKILSKIQSKYDVLIGMGISDMALNLYMASGFRFLKAIPRHIKVYNFEAIAVHAQYTPLAVQLAGLWADSADRPPFDYEPVRQANMADIEDVIRKEFNYFDRNFQFLKWRYAGHPIFEYKQFVVYSKSPDRGCGVFVCLREENSVANLKILHVTDFIGDEKDMLAAMNFINHYCHTNDVHLADFYCTSAKINRYFVGSGWFSINDDKCFQFPHLFYPLELRVPPTTSLIYWSRNRFFTIADMSKLYVTKQDCDLDRPTMDTYIKRNISTT